MKFKGTEVIFYAWILSGFTFLIAEHTPVKWHYYIWFFSLVIPFLVWQIRVLIIDLIKSIKK